ncbi:MAG: DUF6908 domain-containing protein [Nannocystales bacterium]
MSKFDAASLDALVEGLADPTASGTSSSRTLGVDEVGVMVLRIERLGPRTYSMAQGCKEDGEMVRDPEVELFRDEQGRWFPVSFRQDGAMPIYTVALEVDASGIAAVHRRRYVSQRDFMRLWLRSLRAQYGIKSPLSPSLFVTAQSSATSSTSAAS